MDRRESKEKWPNAWKRKHGRQANGNSAERTHSYESWRMMIHCESHNNNDDNGRKLSSDEKDVILWIFFHCIHLHSYVIKLHGRMRKWNAEKHARSLLIEDGIIGDKWCIGHFNNMMLWHRGNSIPTHWLLITVRTMPFLPWSKAWFIGIQLLLLHPILIDFLRPKHNWNGWSHSITAL